MRRRIILGSRPPRLAAVLLWLVAALLFGQSLGSVHRIVHAPRLGAVSWALLIDPVSNAIDSTGKKNAGRSLLPRWFAGHSEADCVLFDQSLQPSPVGALALLQLSAAPISPLQLAPVGISPAGGSSAFDARGPPSLFRRLSA